LKAFKDKLHGFTIIELMVIVAVIAILTVIAIPNFLGLQERAKRRAIKEVASSAVEADSAAFVRLTPS